MRMTPAFLVVGSLVVFWASVFIAVFLPAMTLDEKPSDAWRPLTADERAGQDLYNRNGCSYCHSQFIRTIDWGHGAERIAERGDFVGERPIILGTERTGPDLSEEGGEHPDDWHLAHFTNPRYTRPMSLMPSWEFLGQEDIRKLTIYMQGEGHKFADFRVARQDQWRVQAISAYHSGPDKNIAWLHSNVPQVWRDMPNPYPATTSDLERGEVVYQRFCVNCHGVVGDGNGPAAKYLTPTPLNFTTLKRNLARNKYIGGIFYYQIMNGITGTAMPYFKRELESEKIWDVSNYLGVTFMGYTDATIEPRGIPASYEPSWRNPYMPRAMQPSAQTRPAPSHGGEP